MKSRPDAAHAGLVVKLAEVARELMAEAESSSIGHAARTVIRETDLRVVVIAMRAGATLAEHHASATATVHVLHGQLHVRLDEHTVELAADQLLPIERGLAHEVVAIEPSAFVLVLATSE